MTEQPDSCDRCDKEGRVYVDWSQETGYEGLCGECLDTRTEWAPMDQRAYQPGETR